MPDFDAPIDLKSKSLFARLKRLFSTDVIVRNVGGKMLKIKDTDSVQYATDRNTLRDRFNRVRTSGYSQYSRDFTLAYQTSRIELFRDYDCVGLDTIIPLPDGTYPTIAELAEKYKDKPQERFYVFSYDHVTDSIKLGQAFHPRKKGGREGWKVTFDNGQYVIGSERHPFLMRNGEYKKLKDLTIGESVMPFYQKDFYGQGYRSIYNFSKKWQSEHVLIAEQFNYRDVLDDECVHHRNFDKRCNLPENLQIMKKSDHSAFHMRISNEKIWSAENREKQIQAIRDAIPFRKTHHWNGERIGKNNPFYGKKHTNKSNELRSESLKRSCIDRNQTKEKNPNYREDLTFDVLKIEACEYYKNNGKLNIWELVDEIGCDYSTIQSRLKDNKYNWNTFKTEIVSTLNHKIKSIESIGIIDVYDMTVDEYHNFATDSCFVRNTMDMDPILASALDIYADESIQQNEMGRILTVKSPDDNVTKILDNLFYDIMNIEFNLWSWVRNMVKYGDFYLKLHISPEYGIYLVEPLSSYNVSRQENTDPLNKNYVKYQISFESGIMEELENYQVAHFRLLSDSNFLPYGKSMIESARRVWKQLSLMEDAMLIHRIMRAPEKRIFKIDVGNIPPQEIDSFMEKIINKSKKIPYLDEKTGDYNLRFNLQNMVEDYYLPVRGSDSGTSIDTLSGMEFTGIDDLEYIKTKMMAALKIPKAFLGFDESLSGKATLASEDIRFSRTIQRIQKIIVSELSKIAVVHLYAQGFRDEKLVEFSLELTNPSTLAEKEKISIWGEKMNVAKDMMENKLFSSQWIYENVFKMSSADTENVKSQIIEDMKQLYRLKQIEEVGNDPALSHQKVNDEGEISDLDQGMLGGSEKPDGEDGGPPEPGGEEPKNEPSQPGGELGQAPMKKSAPLKEYDRPSQKGLKKASNYPFGEDPLGSLENNRDVNFKLESVKKNLGGLMGFLEKDTKKELIKEAKDVKSMLDETNIIDVSDNSEK